MFKSVRFKLTFYYTLTLLIVLSLFSFIIYNNLKNSLYEHMDMLLQLRGEGIADALETYMEAEGFSFEDLKSLKNNKKIAKIAENLIRNSRYDPKMSPIEVKIIDSEGALLAYSKDIADIPPISENSWNELIEGNAIYDSFNLMSDENKKYSFRYYATPARLDKHTAYIVQVWRPMYQTELALRHLMNIIVLWVPLIVILTMTVGLFFARIALRPVHEMSAAMRKISADNFKIRIMPPNTKDEIRELADIFNEMLDRLEDSFISQRRFIQDVSHELKTPLTIIKGELEVALKKARSVNEYTAILQNNLEEAEKINRIVQDLLTLAKFDNRDIELDMKKVNLEDLLYSIVEDLSRAIAEKKIAVKTSLKELYIDADYSQLRRAFLNIIDNAIKYSPDGGEIKISTEDKGNEIAVIIEDNGAGISEKDLPHIFKRFYRADSSRSTSGFGLGLSIAKNIFDAHKATINVKSSQGRGSVFSIIFPKD